MTICSRCVMDDTDPKITFDAAGICDHCRTFDREIATTWSNEDNITVLMSLAEQIKSRSAGNDFDCIIGMSGGIDSSYLVHIATTQMGLRPLVFHVDAGWNSDTAVTNIERIVQRLNLDLYTEVVPWKEMQGLQLAFFKSGVPHIDAPQDHAFFATMYKFAAKYNIKHILTGGNFATECIRNPKEWMYYQSDSAQLKDINNKFGTCPLKRFPLTNVFWHKIYLPLVRGICVNRPLDLISYQKNEAVKTLVDLYGYIPYGQKHFESRFTMFYEGYWLPQRFGFDTRKVQYSSLILTGQMDRDAALNQLAKPALSLDQAQSLLEYVCDKLDITPSELESFFLMPKKSFRDYKNQENIYRAGAKVLRLLGKERGGKR